MSVGAATWQDAPSIDIGTYSTPTPRAGQPAGTYRPHHSAWWKFTPPVDTNLIIDSTQTTSADGPTGEADTVLYLYTAAALAAEPDPDFAATVETADDYAGGGRRSRIDTTLTGGVTYYARLGTFNPDDPQVVDLVLGVHEWVWTGWVQPPNAETTLQQPGTGDATLTHIQQKFNPEEGQPPLPQPDGGALEAVVFDSWGSAGTDEASPPALPPAVGTSIIAEPGTNAPLYEEWTYSAGKDYAQNYRASSYPLAMPTVAWSPPGPSSWPVGAVAVQTDGSPPTVLESRVDWIFTEDSKDESNPATPATASGAWTHRLGLGLISPTTGAAVSGPLPTGTEVAGSTVLPIPTDAPQVWAFGSMDLLDVGVHDASFGMIPPSTPPHSSVTLRIAGHWILTTVRRFRPPLIRYKMLISTDTVYGIPALRQLQRGDELGMSGAPRAIQNRSQQASLRNIGFQ